MNSLKPKQSAPKLREKRKAAVVAWQPPKRKRPPVQSGAGDNTAPEARLGFSEAILEWLEEEDYF